MLEVGAAKYESLAALKKSDAKAFEKVWKSVREDGAYVEAGENDNLIVQKLQANPDAVGIFGFSFLEQNAGAVKGIAVDGKVRQAMKRLPMAATRSHVHCSSTPRSNMLT